MSDRAVGAAAYRAEAPLSAAPLVAHVLVPSARGFLGAAVSLGFVVALPFADDMRIWPPVLVGAMVFGLYRALALVPLLTLRARIVDGDLVVTGCRWPGPDVTWSCGLHEVAGFELEARTAANGVLHRRLALRTTDGQLLGLTERLYPGGDRAQLAAAARLNAWLAPLRRG